MKCRQKPVTERLNGWELLYLNGLFVRFNNEQPGRCFDFEKKMEAAMLNAWLIAQIKRDIKDGTWSRYGIAADLDLERLMILLDGITEAETVELFRYATQCRYQIRVTRPAS